MKATKMYLENGLDVSLYALVRAEDAVMTITLYRQPTVGAEFIPAGKAATYSVNDEVRRCFGKDGKLEYEISNKTGISIAFTGGREKMKDGPILRVEQKPN